MISPVLAFAAPALASDALPLEDGVYMRSQQYCRDFKAGKLDMIELEVSEGGRAYGYPEVGCVVANVTKIRMNRYKVEGDCTEIDTVWRDQFILDVKSPNNIRIDGSEYVLCDATATPGAKSVSRSADPVVLIEQWHQANENCRGGSGDDPNTDVACAERQKIGYRLGAANWCFGKRDQSHSAYEWHRCTKKSIRN